MTVLHSMFQLHCNSLQTIVPSKNQNRNLTLMEVPSSRGPPRHHAHVTTRESGFALPRTGDGLTFRCALGRKMGKSFGPPEAERAAKHSGSSSVPRSGVRDRARGSWSSSVGQPPNAHTVGSRLEPRLHGGIGEDWRDAGSESRDA